jgi:hypothetical protein
MSIPVLTQVYDEMRRLAIAGSVTAPGDFRLKKLVAPLEQAGAKAPVFARIAQAVKALVDAGEQNSAPALLELCTLVSAVLYTQGETGIAGEWEPLETAPIGSTEVQASALALKPLLEALSTTGSGRLEVIRDAYEGGMFHDVRLVQPAIDAIDDPYAEIRELLAEKILPRYGTAIVPLLKTRLELKGKAGDVNRLLLMHRLDPDAARPLVLQAFEIGSKEMKTAAIRCLGRSAADIQLLLDQATAKSKEVRAAALGALAQSDEPAGLDLVQRAIGGEDLDLVVRWVNESRNSRLVTFVLGEADRQLDAILEGARQRQDKKALSTQTQRFSTLLRCIDGWDDKATEAFLGRLFDRRDEIMRVKAEPSGADTNKSVAWLMVQGSKSLQARLVDSHPSLPVECLSAAFTAAVSSAKPEAVFEMFVPYLRSTADAKKKAQDPAALKRAEIHDALIGHVRMGRFKPADADGAGGGAARKGRDRADLDPRWLDLALDTAQLDLVCALARPGHPRCQAYLAAEFNRIVDESKDIAQAAEPFRALLRIGYPGATADLVAVIKKHASSRNYATQYWLGVLIRELPKTAVAPLEEMLGTLPADSVDTFFEHISALKNRP